MKVYVVTTGSYSDYSIHSIWSTREKADAMHKILEHGDVNDIDEWELDTPSEDKAGWCISINLTTGLVRDKYFDNGCVIVSPEVVVSDDYDWKQYRKVAGEWRAFNKDGTFPEGTEVTVYAEHFTREQAFKAAQDKRAEVLARLEGVS